MLTMHGKINAITTVPTFHVQNNSVAILLGHIDTFYIDGMSSLLDVVALILC